MTLQIIILLGLLGLVPLGIGFLPVRFMKKEHRSLGMVYGTGWLLLFAVFQIMIIPFIVSEKDFVEAAGLYSILVGVLTLAGVVAGVKIAGECTRNTLCGMGEFGGRYSCDSDKKEVRITEQQKIWLRVLWLLVILVVVLQMVFSASMQYLDGDDALYVTISHQTQTGDGMYLKNPYYGYAQSLDIRHALSPVPIFLAWLGMVSGMHTTIMIHGFIGPVFLMLMYVLYGQIAKRLFTKKKESVPLFLLFLSLWYLFGNVSLFTAETFAYTRTWQGKSMFGNLVVPAMFLFMLFVAKAEMQGGEWCMLFALSAVAAFTTSTGIFMFPIFMALAGLFLAIYQKKLVILFEFAACCTPSIVYGILYLFLK